MQSIFRQKKIKLEKKKKKGTLMKKNYMNSLESSYNKVVMQGG